MKACLARALFVRPLQKRLSGTFLKALFEGSLQPEVSLCSSRAIHCSSFAASLLLSFLVSFFVSSSLCLASSLSNQTLHSLPLHPRVVRWYVSCPRQSFVVVKHTPSGQLESAKGHVMPDNIELEDQCRPAPRGVSWAGC